MKKKILLVLLICVILLTGCGPIKSKKVVKIKKADSIEIPNVKDMDVMNAERVLISSGFLVDDEKEEEYNSEVEEGMVIDTVPAIGRKRPLGTKVKLIVSKGNYAKIIMPDFVGKNYIEAKNSLEKVYKMQVIIEYKEVENNENQDSSLIIEQSIKPGTEVEINEENPTRIILYIPAVDDEYPNFVEQNWTVEQVQELAKKHNLTLTIKYEQSNEQEGKIIAQSRTGKIIDGTSLIITVAKK